LIQNSSYQNFVWKALARTHTHTHTHNTCTYTHTHTHNNIRSISYKLTSSRRRPSTLSSHDGTDSSPSWKGKS
jgi:hypothetical protein